MVWNLLVDLFLSISIISNNTFKEALRKKLLAFMFPSEKRQSAFRPCPHGGGGVYNPMLSIDFVLREAASLSFLTYDKKQNNA